MYKTLNNRRSLYDESYYTQNMSVQTEIRHYFKVILLGNVAVGKTSLMSQFVDEYFQDKYECTISADRQVKSVLVEDNTWVEMNIWDTCGQEKYRTLTRQYYKDAKGKSALKLIL
jgi:Ras-related protein Rab-2A